jgi:hypothetical protein
MNTKQLIIALEYQAIKEYLDQMNPEGKSDAYLKRMRVLHRKLKRLAEDFQEAADIQPMESIEPPPPPGSVPPPDDDL